MGLGDFLSELIAEEKRVFVFLGEAGSGKSELALNFALALSKFNKKPFFFDMDQTKPLFRSRQLKQKLQEKGIIVKTVENGMDIPVIPAAVRETLEDVNVLVIMDVGGNETGAVSIGQFREALEREDVVIYFIVNYYRPFSRDTQEFAAMMEKIRQAARLKKVEIISNPNLGGETSVQEIMEGHSKTIELLTKIGQEVSCLAVREELREELGEQIENLFPGTRILTITRHIKAPWE